MSAVLFAVAPTDALTYAAVSLLLIARRAGRLLRAGAPGDETGSADRAAHGIATKTPPDLS